MPELLLAMPMNFADLLYAVGYAADPVPPALMEDAGWSLLASFRFRGVESPDVVAVRMSIDKAILAVWPHAVRLTADTAAETLSLWRHPQPPPVSTEAFPTPLDLAHALRVLHAVGIARGTRLADARAQALAARADAEAARLTTVLNGEQALFEHVVALLERFPEP